MKKLLILMMLTGVLASCTRGPACPPGINAKPKHSKSLRSVRHRLRVKYHYHQTKVGRIFKFNLF